MKRVEREKAILDLKREIDSRLEDLNIYKAGELILWLLQNEMYQKVKRYDEQLMILDLFIDIWRKEKSDNKSFQMQGDIFAYVNSLEEIEAKYLVAKFAFLRIENEMPYEYCTEAVDVLVEYQYSPHALYEIMKRENADSKEMILKLAPLLQDRNALTKAVGLLQLVAEEGIDEKRGE